MFLKFFIDAFSCTGLSLEGLRVNPFNFYLKLLIIFFDTEELLRALIKRLNGNARSLRVAMKEK